MNRSQTKKPSTVSHSVTSGITISSNVVDDIALAQITDIAVPTSTQIADTGALAIEISLSFAAIMVALAKEYRSIPFPPSIDWFQKVEALSLRIKALRLNLPTDNIPKGGCGGLRVRRRYSSTGQLPRGLSGLPDLSDLLLCADDLVDRIKVDSAVPDPDAPTIDPSIDELEEQGENLQEVEEEEEEEEEQQSTTAAKASSSTFSSTIPSENPTPYVIYPTIGGSLAQMSSIFSALSSMVGTNSMVTMESSASATVFVAIMNESNANI